MIDEIWCGRQPEDYSGTNINKRDFMRSWTHCCTAQHISIEDMIENGTSIDGEKLYELEDPRGEFESTFISEVQMDQFKSKLTDVDKAILQMRYDGHSLKEIAAEVGFKTPGAVRKHIEKITGVYEDFVPEGYSVFGDKYAKCSDTTNDAM